MASVDLILSQREEEAANELAYRERAAEDLLAFTTYTFPEFVLARHQGPMVKLLNAVERGDIKRAMIFCPPRHAKTELATRRLIPFHLGRHPDDSVIVASYGIELAEDFGEDIRTIIETPEYGRIFEDVRIQGSSASKQRFRIEGRRGRFYAVGVDTTILGRGANLLVIDDPVKNKNEAYSTTFRERAWDWFRTTALTRLEPDARIVLTMQRWHDDDLAGRILDRSGKEGFGNWTVLRLPAMAIADDVLGRKVGEELWPERFPLERLNEIRAAQGPYWFSSLYQQNPVPDEGNYFQKQWFEPLYDEAPERDQLQVYASSDFATTDGAGDFTVHGIWGVDPQHHIYLLDIWRGQKDSLEWVEQMLNMAFKWRPNTWFVEKGQIWRSVQPLQRKRSQEKGIYVYIDEITGLTSGDKEFRARPFQGRAAMGMVHLPASHQHTELVLTELLRFPGGRYDDIVDMCGNMGQALDKLLPGKPPPQELPMMQPRTYSIKEHVQMAMRGRQGHTVRYGAPMIAPHPTHYDESEDEDMS